MANTQNRDEAIESVLFNTAGKLHINTSIVEKMLTSESFDNHE